MPTTRRKGNQTPVLVLTARDAVSDRVTGLDAGADDYLVKPFDLDELAARVRHGMSPVQAIRSATLYSAQALGLTDRGQVKAGLLADLIAVEGNPLEDVSLLQHVRFVMKRGIVYRTTD